MSILLEALRKTEKNQHLRETPTIHTENLPGPVSEPLPTRWLVLLLVVALILTGWFVWRQYRQPAPSVQPQVVQEVSQAPAVSQPVVEESPPVQTVPSSTPKPTSAGQNRTPVESYQAPDGNNAPSESGTVPADIADTKTASDTSMTTNRTAATNTAGTGLKEPAPKAVADEPVKTSVEEYHPGEPAPISYWELPDAVRADIPEIKFSVLVYSLKPADRFVLINGQRLGEGDTAQPGLVVKEIRREGVVFSYRLYQFLVEK